MYKRRTPGSKRDPVKQWRLPHRVFFAAGACHILAYAFLKSYPESGFEPSWIRPMSGHTGNHIVLTRGDVVFDYHGYSRWNSFWIHTKRRANQWWPGWDAEIVPIDEEALISNEAAVRYMGLHMKEPQDYLFDPFPRAQRYLERFSAPGEVTFEKIRAALNTQGPHCGASIPPDKQKRLDVEHMECPSCGNRFVPRGQ